MTKRSSAFCVFTNIIRDANGNFAMMAALVATPLFLAAGMAIDYSVATSEKVNLQQIADSAVLAGATIFTGDNLAQAQALATNYIKAHSDAEMKGISYEVTANNRTLQITMKRAVATSLMRIANINSVDVGVSASAVSPLKPTTVKFSPQKSQGWYYKKITILVTRKGSARETSLGTVIYQPTTRDDGGQGTMTVNPAGDIELGDYTKLVLQMDIKHDSCPPRTSLSMSGNTVICKKSSKAVDKDFNATLRTDNPATSHYLFVDGNQLPKGVVQPLENYFGCGEPQSHAWEDGGGFERQDFFYKVSSDCTANGDYVRLVN